MNLETLLAPTVVTFVFSSRNKTCDLPATKHSSGVREGLPVRGSQQEMSDLSTRHTQQKIMSLE